MNGPLALRAVEVGPPPGPRAVEVGSWALRAVEVGPLALRAVKVGPLALRAVRVGSWALRAVGVGPLALRAVEVGSGSRQGCLCPVEFGSWALRAVEVGPLTFPACAPDVPRLSSDVPRCPPLVLPLSPACAPDVPPLSTTFVPADPLLINCILCAIFRVLGEIKPLNKFWISETHVVVSLQFRCKLQRNCNETTTCVSEIQNLIKGFSV